MQFPLGAGHDFGSLPQPYPRCRDPTYDNHLTPLPLNNNFQYPNNRMGVMQYEYGPGNGFGIAAPAPISSYRSNVNIVEGWHRSDEAKFAGAPQMEYAFDMNGNPPFIDLTRRCGPSGRGVIMIKNIPYNLTLPEVTQFMRKYLLPQNGSQHSQFFPIHIIMERPTAKTMDCFVEVDNAEVVRIAIQRFDALVMSGQSPKMGTRHVSVESSSQGQLMKELFPRAKSVLWDAVTGMPTLVENVDPYSDGFRGFVTGEEMAGLVRHAEFPNRSPFSSRCLQRTYESMISTLAKFPWFSIYYTMEVRDKLFETYLSQLRILIRKVAPENGFYGKVTREVGLDSRLLSDLILAGLECPGFSERQKVMIANTGGHCGSPRINNFGSVWPFKTLCRSDRVGDQAIGAWLDLLGCGAAAARNAHEPLGIKPYLHVGFDETGHTVINHSLEASMLSFADLARMEKMLMLMTIQKGWQQWYTIRGMPYVTEDIPDPDLTMVEQMMSVSLQQQDAQQPEASINQHSPISAAESEPGIHNMCHLLHDSQEDDPCTSNEDTPKATMAILAMTVSRDPFADQAIMNSGLGAGLVDAAQQAGLEVRVRMSSNIPKHLNPESPEFAPYQDSENQSFSEPSADLSKSILASNFAIPRPGSNAIKIRRPDGGEFGFNAVVQQTEYTKSSPKNSLERGRDGRYDIFEPPSRRGSLGSCSDVSSHSSGSRGQKTSPRNNYTVPEPVGTPPRRSQPRKTVSIDHTIHEESEDEDELLMGTGRRNSDMIYGRPY